MCALFISDRNSDEGKSFSIITSILELIFDLLSHECWSVGCWPLINFFFILLLFFLLLSGSGTIRRRVRLVGCDNVSDVSDAVIIKIKITEVSLTCVDQNSEKFQDGLITFALSQSLHRCVDKVELLL